MPSKTEVQEEQQLTWIEWRLTQLVRAGYNRRNATKLAKRDRDVDLHEAIRLIENGCPQETAVKILL